MNIKMKALVAAVALAAAGNANAAIDYMSTGDGEMFFAVRDNVNNVSYALDLNVKLSAFLPTNAPSTLTYAADANLTNFLSTGSGNYSWAVMAGDTTGPATAGGLRFLTTSTANATTVGATTNGTLAGFSLVDTGFVADVNFKLIGSDSAISTNAEASYFEAAFDTWSYNTTWTTTAGIGQSMNFYYLANSGSTTTFTTRVRPATLTEFAGQWTLAQDGTLTYAAAVPPSAVPVPAAVWLLGSAMVGLVGVARRKVQA